jgi:hypothetical protein
MTGPLIPDALWWVMSEAQLLHAQIAIGELLWYINHKAPDSEHHWSNGYTEIATILVELGATQACA